MTPGYLKLCDAAKYISVNRTTLRRMLREFKIPSIFINHNLHMVAIKDLDNFMNSRKAGSIEDLASL